MSPTKLPDGDWSKRTKPISFRKLMSLKQIGQDQFESLSSGYPPTSISRTYGGHVYAQAVWAASKTVAKGQYVHNVTGHFLLIGDCSTPFQYHIKRVRDGGIYCLRLVEVYQDSASAEGGKVPCFIATISFKRDESNKKKVREEFGHQEVAKDHIHQTYRKVLEGKKFEDHAIEPAADGFWSKDLTSAQWKQRGDGFPGLEMRKVDMRSFNGQFNANISGEEVTRNWRLLLFYRILRDQDCEAEHNRPDLAGEDESDINLHACAHLYASDRNSLFLIQRALGYTDRQVQMGSLSHTVHFHVSPSRLLMLDRQGQRKMFVQESWTNNTGEDRGCHVSRLWDYDEGLIIASTMQDGMIRVPKDIKKWAYDGDTPTSVRASKL